MTARMPDIAPTLTDTQVLEFCHRGYLILEGVVAPETNERVGEFIRAHPYATGDGGEFKDDRLLAEEWFVKEVILNRQAAGAVRSLLGRQAALPTWMFTHRSTQPKPAQQWRTATAASATGMPSTTCRYSTIPRTRPANSAPPKCCPARIFSSTSDRIWATTAASAGLRPLRRRRAPFSLPPTRSGTAVAHLPPRACAICSNTSTGAWHHRDTTGSFNPILTSTTSTTSKTPSTAAGCIRPKTSSTTGTTRPGCSTGWRASRTISTTSSAPQPGPWATPPRRQPGDFHTYPEQS